MYRWNDLKEDLKIVYEDNHLLVVNKSSGILVQGDRTEDISLIELGKEYIKRKYNKPGNVFLGLVHRLDRPVSGLVILARTSKALIRMNEQFRSKSVDKIYWAITEKPLPSFEGNIINWLIKNRQKNIVKAYRNDKKGSVKAELAYRTLSVINSLYLTEVKLITGRFHQIRAQFAAAGCPIIGDLKYGYKKPNPDKSICLHARAISFIHPVSKKAIHLNATLPSLPVWKFFSPDYS